MLLSIGFLGLPAPAHADEGQYEEFYTPPDPLPAGVPGDLIRTEPSRLVLEPSGQLGAFVATGIRIMYRSTDARGNPNAVTGTYFEPDNPWPGNGPRPLIAYAPGTQGQGDQCAPSRMFNQGIHFSSGLDIMFNYEELFVATMVARGFAVVVTDYEGLGTPGVHTYVNRVAEGQALADAARAAMRLPGTSLDPHGPVAFWGYSQGGGAAASAAGLAPGSVDRHGSAGRGASAARRTRLCGDEHRPDRSHSRGQQARGVPPMEFQGSAGARSAVPRPGARAAGGRVRRGDHPALPRGDADVR